MFGIEPATASNSSSSTAIVSSKVLFHGVLSGTAAGVPDGDHNFRIRLFGLNGALIHEEVLTSEVRTSVYDLLLGSTAPLHASLTDEYDISILIDDKLEVRSRNRLSNFLMICDGALASSISTSDRIFVPLDNQEISAQMAERIATQRGVLHTPYYQIQQLLPWTPVTGLSLEMSLAPPAEQTPTDAYQLAKYGRLAVSFDNFATIGGNRFGLAAQALHVAHHLLFYSAGLTSDINNDGMFLFSAGLAHYQTGNKRTEPFVDAPFMRIKFQSSQEDVFAYSELETTMHFRSYVSGMAGIGFRISRGVRVIGGFHHTEFVMPSEQVLREVNGMQGILLWGL